MITSASNDKIKEIKKLIKSASRRKETGLYIVEGIRMVREIPADAVKTLYVAESMTDKFADICNQIPAEVEIVRDSVFQSMSDTNTPQGILAEVYQTATTEGAGVTGIILSADTVDIYNPKVIRSTMGSIFRMPIAVAEDLAATIDRVKTRGIPVYGAHLDGATFYEKDFTGGCAFLIGNEGNGLSDEISAKADDLIRIPMCGQVESLNAAISTAVIAYEVLRQRSTGKK